MTNKLACLQFVDEFVADGLELIQLGGAVEWHQDQWDQQDALEGDDGGHEATEMRLAKVVAEAHSGHGDCREPQDVQEVRIVLERAFKIIGCSDNRIGIIVGSLEHTRDVRH